MTTDPNDPATPPLPKESPAGPIEADAIPFAHGELTACLSRPHRMLDIVLGERLRLAANLRTGNHMATLVTILLLCSVAFAVPFALIDGFSRVADITLLFLGSVLLCFPSLQVFGSYLGVRMHPAQNLAIALVIPSAAALFTFGFAPIYWFLDFTMPSEAGAQGSAITRVVLLVFSLLLALSHLNRCLFADKNLKALRENWPLWVGWQVLLVFLTYRMAETLGLFL
ncbi:MAG: hypothetical protein ACI85K_001128 [Hyphomicrobiaceae bacterium]|jgi:hypothetical protein